MDEQLHKGDSKNPTTMWRDEPESTFENAYKKYSHNTCDDYAAR